MDYPSRLRRLRARLAPERIDCLLISSLPNIRYLTGFTGSNALLLVEESSLTFFTDGRYTEQAASEVSGARRVVPKRGGLVERAAKGLKGDPHRRIGFEVSAGFQYFRKLREELKGRRLRPVSGVVERLREVKDEEEIALLRASVELNSRVLAEVLPLVRPGVQERDLAAEVEYRMRRHGAEKASFDTMVTSGPRSALPHARPSARPLGKNEFVLFDQGAILNGYASDMTRTVFLGAAGPADRELYATVLEAQLAAIAAVRAGVACSKVDRAARAPIGALRWGRYFSHSTGHGVGLEIHEGPRLARKEPKGEETILPAGAVVTIEPGVYLPGRGGVRIEDMVVVRENGAEVLTPSPKAFLEIQ